MAARSFTLVAAVLGSALLLAASTPAGAVLLAFTGGTVVERWRQGQRRAPLTLGATPRAWRAWLARLNRSRAAGVALLLAAAIAVLLLPSVHIGGSGAGVGTAAAPARLVFPSVSVRQERLAHPFSAARIRFRVYLPGRVVWAQTIRRSSLSRGARWVVVAVDVVDRSGRRFNPSRLDWRLEDAGGRVYAPSYGGGTGDSALALNGVLTRRAAAQMRLGFQVPRRARGLALVWEPVRGGTAVRVALTGG